MNKAKKVLDLFKEGFQSKEDAIEQAKVNAKYFNAPYYVNDTTNGLKVERDPVKDTGIGTKTICKVTPEGEVEEIE